MKANKENTILLASLEHADMLQVNDEPILIVQAKARFMYTVN